MGWAKLDDRYPEHPKVIGLSDAAFRLHVRALCYAAGHLTDGVLPEAFWQGRLKLREELTKGGLLEPFKGLWRLHDYHEFNPPRGQILERRRRDSERKRARSLDGRWPDSARIPDGIGEEASGPVPVPVPVEEKTGEHPEKTPAAGPRAVALLDLWNENRGPFPKATKLTKWRASHARARLLEQPDLKVWKAAILRATKSAFCRGEVGERGWVADFEWLIRPDTLTRLLEGKYDDTKPAGPGNVLRNAEAERMKASWEANERLQAEHEKRAPKPYPFGGADR